MNFFSTCFFFAPSPVHRLIQRKKPESSDESVNEQNSDGKLNDTQNIFALFFFMHIKNRTPVTTAQVQRQTR